MNAGIRCSSEMDFHDKRLARISQMVFNLYLLVWIHVVFQAYSHEGIRGAASE